MDTEPDLQATLLQQIVGAQRELRARLEAVRLENEALLHTVCGLLLLVRATHPQEANELREALDDQLPSLLERGADQPNALVDDRLSMTVNHLLRAARGGSA